MKIYQLNEYEWYAGRSLDEVIDYAIGLTGLDYEELTDGIDPHELTGEELNKNIFVDENGVEMSFKDHLKDLKEFPCLFACTEW